MEQIVRLDDHNRLITILTPSNRTIYSFDKTNFPVTRKANRDASRLYLTLGDTLCMPRNY